MLVVLSDLHLGDGAASAENVPPRACALFLDHVLDLAEHSRARKVTLLFLGDIFDLLRTEHWFYPAPGVDLPGERPPAGEEPFPMEERPWGPGGLTPAGRGRALAIARAIVARCAAQLDIFSGRDAGLHGAGDADLSRRFAQKKRDVEIERIFLPGNHDRLAWEIPELRDLFCERLGARLPWSDENPPPAGAAKELQEDGRLVLNAGVVARHGHEVDPLNFDGARLGRSLPVLADYRRMPIGDPITTECLARLPFEVRAELTARVMPPQLVEEVAAHLQEIEDVRPLSSAVGWLTQFGARGAWRSSPHAEEVLRVVGRVAGSVLPRMLALESCRDWTRRHRWRDFPTVAALHVVAWLFETFSLPEVARLLALIERIGAALRLQDRGVKAALGRLGGGGEKVVFGHTHAFLHAPLHVGGPGPDRVYLNSGTWRTRVHRAADRSGHLRAKDLTWLVFYGPDETPGGGHAGASWEAWNGVLRKR